MIAPTTIRGWLMFYASGGVLSLQDWDELSDDERAAANAAYMQHRAIEAVNIAAAIAGDKRVMCMAAGEDYESYTSRARLWAATKAANDQAEAAR